MERTGGGSRLLQMQARFQQKQMAEREMKIASLYEAQQARALDRVRQSSGSTTGTSVTSSPPAHLPIQPGKVRQMFEERRTRTKAGIDKSYPLQPIHNTDRIARKDVANGRPKVATTRTHVDRKERGTRGHVTATNGVKLHKIESIVNGAGDVNHNHQPDMNNIKHPVAQRNNNPIHSSFEVLDTVDHGYMLEDETFPDALAPEQTPRTPEPKKPPRRNPVVKKTSVKPPPVAPPRKTANENKVSESGTGREAMKQSSRPAIAKSPLTSRSTAASVTSKAARPRPAASSSGAVAAAVTSQAGSAPGAGPPGAPCAVCGRTFAPDRLAKHEEICRKTAAKKRKPFDALKHRLAGTEAEPFIGKLRKTKTAPSTTKLKPLNNNWRQKHQDFISAIRAAKQVQAHLAAGGNLKDLPPPPPSENPDYVQCPHCSRRFNQAAADRHIPKCANFQFNKPKPAAPKRR